MATVLRPDLRSSMNVQSRVMGVTVPSLAMPSISTSGLPMRMSTWLSGLVAAEMGTTVLSAEAFARGLQDLEAAP
jgi:hypothetical protein